MTEYIEREEAEKRLFQRAEIANSAYIDQTPSQIMMLAQNVVHLIPAADVRPVVLCQDCKHFQVNVSPSGYLPQGVPEWECRYWLRPTDPTDFCSYGEKREES